MPTPIIQTHDLRKVFRTVKRSPGALGALRTLFSRDYADKVAVDGISMSLEAGELVGYIGPNGAGKSTTIKMLTGILTPTAGSIEVAGLVPYAQRKANARNIGVVFGQRSQLYWDLPLIESFELLRAIYAVPAQRYRRNLDAFTALLELGDFLNTPVRQLSLGQRMRGDFAAAMMHDPVIVYLDEPTIGLDVVAKEAIRQFVAEINRERGTTIILTTHDLADVERLCRRIVLIDNGTLIYDGTIEVLKEQYGTHRTLVIELCGPDPAFTSRARRSRRMRELACACASTAAPSAPTSSSGSSPNGIQSTTSQSKNPNSRRLSGASTSKATSQKRWSDALRTLLRLR